jgi:plastocyanin
MNIKRTQQQVLLLFFIVFLPGAVRAEGQGAAIKGTVKIYDNQGHLKKNQSGVVVFLDDLENPPAQVTPPNKNPVITQMNECFMPNILPVLVGTTVDFPNEDKVYHNVFSLSKAKSFDLGIYAQGARKAVTFDKTGLVKIYCNIHPQMNAYILVLANPYFTVTDIDGHFEVHDIPEGKAVLRTWYPFTKENPERELIVTRAGVQDVNLSILEKVDIQIKEDIISIGHKNKWGQDYPAKY